MKPADADVRNPNRRTTTKQRGFGVLTMVFQYTPSWILNRKRHFSPDSRYFERLDTSRESRIRFQTNAWISVLTHFVLSFLRVPLFGQNTSFKETIRLLVCWFSNCLFSPKPPVWSFVRSFNLSISIHWKKQRETLKSTGQGRIYKRAHCAQAQGPWLAKPPPQKKKM